MEIFFSPKDVMWNFTGLGPVAHGGLGPKSRLIGSQRTPADRSIKDVSSGTNQSRSPSPCDQVVFQSRHGITGDANLPTKDAVWLTRLSSWCHPHTP